MNQPPPFKEKTENTYIGSMVVDNRLEMRQLILNIGHLGQTLVDESVISGKDVLKGKKRTHRPDIIRVPLGRSYIGPSLSESGGGRLVDVFVSRGERWRGPPPTGERHDSH